MVLDVVTVFLGAFLLFQIQPIIAARILPWFGGAAGVWSACMLFFQVFLLVGYAYAHGLVRWARPRTQTVVHGVLLLASLVFLPVVPSEFWKPKGDEEPVLRIVALLVATIGLPYLLLATTGPLVQTWLVRRMPAAEPYRLFALGNLAALMALLAYPIAVQPRLTITRQLGWWSAGYALYAILCVILALRSSRQGGVCSDDAADGASVATHGLPGSYPILWVALPACASVLLLAVTNHLTKDVAPIPFLWVLPLTLYLLTFVVCFEYPTWYHRRTFFNLLLGAFGVVVLVTLYGPGLGITTATALLTGAFFVCCMVCHGELARLRPHPLHLTGYYLMIALGGALGGVFVGLIAPHVFPYYFELPLGLAGCLLLAVLILHREAPAARRREGRRIVAAVVVVLLVYLALEVGAATRHARIVTRNFFGTVRVYDTTDPLQRRRQMAHGAVIHGEQFLDRARRRQPTSYFGPQTGVGLLLAYVQERGPLRVGIIGLGAGVLASYGRAGDVMRFYEINPLVVTTAASEFTFLSDSPARIDIVVGDGRLALEREPPQAFDVLVLDAFSGDAIPMHLLTTEAFGVYFRHLAPRGVVAINVSNRYLDLFPVVAAAARAWGREAVRVATASNAEQGVSEAHWVLVTQESSEVGDVVLAAARAHAASQREVRAWTDDYGDLFQALR